MVLSVLQIVAPVFVIIAAGYAALRLGYLEAAALVGLSAFVLRVALPGAGVQRAGRGSGYCSAVSAPRSVQSVSE